MVGEARELLRLMGVPTVQAPSEGEAQAAYMAATSPDVWAAASKDYDSLLFGAPRLVRFLTISGKEFLPSQGTFRPIVPDDRTRTSPPGLANRPRGAHRPCAAGRHRLQRRRQRDRPEKSAEAGAAARPHRADAAGHSRGARRSGAARRRYGVFISRQRSLANSHPPDSSLILDGLVQFLCDDREFGRERVVAAVERTFRERSLGLDR